MKYANTNKDLVITLNPKTGKELSIPRGHRLWAEFGIDLAEQENRIAAADPQPEQAQ
ncbi:hypothetical protein [Vibrio europaeus]|uniref:hypothetical protein n=1 Tax=Vibrio europaeus TaxID=300876 RepID=UPI00233F5AAA|nr:hypothetical protein [Vibrio europaeus]MDC5719435.1 hypothetical protein [Vibrio europaeus]MDC5720969.1 hypothetical protein [Vibrio europaeus]